MSVLVCLVLVLAMASPSRAAYCLCKDGLGESDLQKVLDFSCGHGANCQTIQPSGNCYSSLQNRCSYAATSYYQAKFSSGATCDFGGACVTSQSLPSGVSSNCFSSSSSTGTPSTPTNGTRAPTTGTPITGTPTTTPPTTTTPTTGTPTTTPPTTTTPTTGTPTTTPPSTTTPTTTTPSTGGTTGTGIGTPTLTPTTSTPFGMAPAMNSGISTDSSAGGLPRKPSWFTSMAVVALLLPGLVLPPFWG